MGNVTVLLTEDYPQLGFIGEKLVVRRGYARNFLIPRGIAVEINSRNAKAIKNQLERIEVRKRELRELAEREKGNLSDVSLTFKLRSGESGKLYGSVTARMIAEELKNLGVKNVERRSVKLSEPIKSLGSFNVVIKLHSEVECSVVVNIEAEGAPSAVKVEKEGENKEEASKSSEVESEAQEENVQEGKEEVEAAAS